MLAEALALARALNDRTAECKVLWNLLLLNIYAGRRELAADYGEQGLTLARELNDLSQRAFLLNDAGTNYYILSKFQRSREILREAQSLWRQLDNRVMLGDSLNWEAMSAWYMGETEQSISLTEEAFVGAESIDNQWGVAFACAICAYPLAMSGKMDLALERLLLGQAIGNKLNLLGSVIPIHVQLARALIFLGDYSSALQAAQVAIDAANTTLPLWRAWALSGLIYVRLAQGDLPEVERLIAEARQALKREHFSAPHTIWQIDLSEISLALIQNNPSRAVTLANTLLNYLREIGARSHLPETYLLKGRALLAQNQVQAAHRILEDALIEAKSVQAYSVVWEIMSVLGEVEAARGENETAEAWRRQARQIVAALAENISRADVRQSFLNRTDIRKLMSKE
jgi:tetratricopeptide (TPR) repeat protein